MMGEAIHDDLVPKPQHNTATRFGRGDHGNDRAAVNRRKPRQGGRCIKVERHPPLPQVCRWNRLAARTVIKFSIGKDGVHGKASCTDYWNHRARRRLPCRIPAQ